MDGLYEKDALAWAERQAELLTRLARGERVNADIDWSNVIEEVRDVGLTELRACRSLLEQAIRHLIKLHAEPEHLSANHWKAEVQVFLDDALDRYTPAMAERIEVAKLYRRALKLDHKIAQQLGRAIPPLPQECPFGADDLLTEEPDLDRLIGLLG